MLIITPPNDAAVFIRCSGGSTSSNFGLYRGTKNTDRQYQRVNRANNGIPKNAPVYIVKSHPPGKGNAFKTLVAKIQNGTVRKLYIDHVSRLSHSADNLGVIWAELIRQGLRIFVCGQQGLDPYASITATKLLELLAKHESEYLAKQYSKPKRRVKDKLRACMRRLANGEVIVDPWLFHKVLKPLFDAERIFGRCADSRGRKDQFIADYLTKRGHFTFNGKRWNARNVKKYRTHLPYQLAYRKYRKLRKSARKAIETSKVSVSTLNRVKIVLMQGSKQNRSQIHDSSP